MSLDLSQLQLLEIFCQERFSAIADVSEKFAEFEARERLSDVEKVIGFITEHFQGTVYLALAFPGCGDAGVFLYRRENVGKDEMGNLGAVEENLREQGMRILPIPLEGGRQVLGQTFRLLSLHPCFECPCADHPEAERDIRLLKIEC